MTVQELIEQLQKEDPEATVLTSDFEWGYFGLGEIERLEEAEVNQGFGSPTIKVKNVVVL